MQLVTWNMQGSTGVGESKWNTDVKRLFLQSTARVLLLQEAGTPPPTAQLFNAPGFLTPLPPALGFPNWAFLRWNLGTNSRPDNVYIYWVRTDPGANRNNLAVAFREIPANLMIIPNPVANPARPTIGVRFTDGQQTLDLYTLHSFSGGGGDAPGFLNAIDVVANGQAWAAGGDFNRNPATMNVPYVLCPHNDVATHPGSGTNLDYLYKNFLPPEDGIVDDQFVVSDHFPVLYNI